MVVEIMAAKMKIKFLQNLPIKNTKINPQWYKVYCYNLTMSFYFIISSSGVYDNVRAILNDHKLDVRVQYMIEVMFAIRKDGFKVRMYIPRLSYM